MVEVVSKKGKGEYLRRRLLEGGIEQVCECVSNVDLSVGGCMSLVHPELLREVLENGGRYGRGIKGVRNRWGDDHRCFYCYAARHNKASVAARVVGEKMRENFERLKPKVVRVGMWAESGHVFYLDALKDLLHLCKDYHSGVIFTTKMFPFGKEGLTEDVAKWLPKQIVDNTPSGKELVKLLLEVERASSIGSVLSYSLGNDKLEPGAAMQGYTNVWRIRQAELYAQEGVNVVETLVADVTSSFDDNAKSGFVINEALNSRGKGMTLRILPIRLNKRLLAGLVTGANWERLIDKSGQGYFAGRDSMCAGGSFYSHRKNNELDPEFWHPDFKKLVDEGIGVCGRVGEIEYCDKCNLYGRDERIAFPKNEIIPVALNVLERRKLDKIRKKKRKEGGQGTLGFGGQEFFDFENGS